MPTEREVLFFFAWIGAWGTAALVLGAVAGAVSWTLSRLIGDRR